MEPLGDLAVGGFRAPRARARAVEIGGKPRTVGVVGMNLGGKGGARGGDLAPGLHGCFARAGAMGQRRPPPPPVPPAPQPWRPEHRRMANAIRALAMDAVEQAKSGHPGLPMGAADIATVLFTQFLKFDPADPAWPDRDRFVLSAGRGSLR